MDILKNKSTRNKINIYIDNIQFAIENSQEIKSNKKHFIAFIF